jgi:hypothetical protein
MSTTAAITSWLGPLASGLAWDCGYRYTEDGSWLGPLAPCAENRRFMTARELAIDLLDGWVTAVIPHHEWPDAPAQSAL